SDVPLATLTRCTENPMQPAGRSPKLHAMVTTSLLKNATALSAMTPAFDLSICLPQRILENRCRTRPRRRVVSGRGGSRQRGATGAAGAHGVGQLRLRQLWRLAERRLPDVEAVREVRCVGIPIGQRPEVPLPLDEPQHRGVVVDDV